MKLISTSSAWVVLLGAFAAAGGAAPTAPSSFPPCLVQYTYSSAAGSSKRVVLYDASGAYTEIESRSMPIITVPGPGPSTSAPHHGTFTYVSDANRPDHASLVYDGGGPGTLPKDELYFFTANGGAEQPSDSVIALGEVTFAVYPLQTSDGAINFSQRSTLAPGGSTISGFVIGETQTRWVFLRAVGASLARFGVSATVAQPSFTVFDAQQNVVGKSEPWGADPNLRPGYQTIASLVGAFPLADDSDEGVRLIALPPGTYTAVFKAQSAGEILGEAYTLPFASAAPVSPASSIPTPSR